MADSNVTNPGSSAVPVAVDEDVPAVEEDIAIAEWLRGIMLQSTPYAAPDSFPYPSISHPSPQQGDGGDYVNEPAMDHVADYMRYDEYNSSLLTSGVAPTLTDAAPTFADVLTRDQLLRLRAGAGTDDDWWTLCQLPVFVVLFVVVGVLAVTFIVLQWLKSQMLESEKEPSGKGGEPLQKMMCPCPTHGASNDDRWIYHTVINLKCAPEDKPPAIPVQPKEMSQEDSLKKVSLPLEERLEPVAVPVAEVMRPTPSTTPERRPEVVRMRARGLLERRGSNVSLTIDLPQSNADTPAHIITPTRECSAEEFLLSAGNSLCRAQLRTCLRDTGSLHREFWDIPLNHPEEVHAGAAGCNAKNRYKSILPNEKSRVRLADTEDSYINANYIRGYDGEERAYIATQGPLGNTVADLYHMVWSHRSPIIVMMTHLVENTKHKCEPYFPLQLHQTATYGPFLVTVDQLIQRNGYTVRHLQIQYKEERRQVIHYWYDTWPDHKTPQNTQSILAMATEIESLRTNLKNPNSSNNNESTSEAVGPVVVHCSAGIGRTGCFIAISLAICQLLEENKVDLLGIVCQMRYDRGGMIQTAEQYEFVHRAIAMFETTLPDTGTSQIQS